MEKFYITFGQNHTHKVGKNTVDKDTVGIIQANFYVESRKIAFDIFEDKFFTVYTQNYWDTKLKQNVMQYFPSGFVNINF